MNKITQVKITIPLIYKKWWYMGGIYQDYFVIDSYHELTHLIYRI